MSATAAAPAPRASTGAQLAGVSASLRASLAQPLVQLRPPVAVPSGATHLQAWPVPQSPAQEPALQQQHQQQQKHVTLTVLPDGTASTSTAAPFPHGGPPVAPQPIPAPHAAEAALIQMAALSALPFSSAPPQPPGHSPPPPPPPAQQGVLFAPRHPPVASAPQPLPPQPLQQPQQAPAGPTGWPPSAPPAQKQPWVPSLPSGDPPSPNGPPASSSTASIPLRPRTATSHQYPPAPPSSQWAVEALQRQQQQQHQALPPGRIASPGAPSVRVTDVNLVDDGRGGAGYLLPPPQQQHLRQRSLAASGSGGSGGGGGNAPQGLPHSASWSHQQQQPPWQELPPVKGTLRGVYKGRASEEWLAKEVQKEVDDLAKCVDAFSVVREERLAATRRANLQGQCEALSAERSALAQRVAQLAMLLPEEDGEFRRLRAELLRLEQDCDALWARYQVEMRAKAAAEELAKELQARLAWLESQLTSFGITILSPTEPGGPPRLTAARARAAVKNDGVVVLEADPASVAVAGRDDDTRDQQQGAAGQGLAGEGGAPPLPPGPPEVTPEAVLAAVDYLRKKGELPPNAGIGRYPNTRAVALRILLLVVLIGSVTGAVLATYFLTKAYGR